MPSPLTLIPSLKALDCLPPLVAGHSGGQAVARAKGRREGDVRHGDPNWAEQRLSIFALWGKIGYEGWGKVELITGD